MRAFGRPPELVKHTCICAILGKSNLDWEHDRATVCHPSFINSVARLIGSSR